jgi:hypothetical protein
MRADRRETPVMRFSGRTFSGEYRRIAMASAVHRISSHPIVALTAVQGSFHTFSQAVTVDSDFALIFAPASC